MKAVGTQQSALSQSTRWECHVCGCFNPRRAAECQRCDVIRRKPEPRVREHPRAGFAYYVARGGLA